MNGLNNYHWVHVVLPLTFDHCRRIWLDGSIFCFGGFLKFGAAVTDGRCGVERRGRHANTGRLTAVRIIGRAPSSRSAVPRECANIQLCHFLRHTCKTSQNTILIHCDTVILKAGLLSILKYLAKHSISFKCVDGWNGWEDG